MAIGVPSVSPFSVPDRISMRSPSLRSVPSLLPPGRRRSNCGWISAAVNAIRGGTPSTTTPTPAQCDSPKLLILKNLPKLLDISFLVCKKTQDLRIQNETLHRVKGNRFCEVGLAIESAASRQAVSSPLATQSAALHMP